jgi:tetratricopeptide (TPR) repeat protein
MHGNPNDIVTMFDDADAEFHRALRFFPEQPDVLSNLGTLWLYRWRVGNHPESSLERARTLLARVVEKRPLIDFGHFRMGQVLRRLGDFDSAAESLQRALAAPFHELPTSRISDELELANAHDPRD